MNQTPNGDLPERPDFHREMLIHFQKLDEAERRDEMIERTLIGTFVLFAMAYMAIALVRMPGLLH